MEQTSHTPAPSYAALRQNIHIRLIAQAEALLRDLEDLEAPQTAQAVERHAKAALAVSKLFDKLIPPIDQDEAAVPERKAAPVAPVAPVPMNGRTRAWT
jgi:hypothetical protein